MTVIDSHLHVWDLNRADYPWLGPHLAPIDVSLGLDDVRADLRCTGVDGVVLVQAADTADRLMLGSDWTLAIPAGGYRRVWGELARPVGELPAAEREAVLGGTAAAFYGLGTR